MVGRSLVAAVGLFAFVLVAVNARAAETHSASVSERRASLGMGSAAAVKKTAAVVVRSDSSASSDLATVRRLN
jgi:hypothetical protein